MLAPDSSVRFPRIYRKSPQVFRALLTTQGDFNSSVVWSVSIFSPMSSFPIFLAILRETFQGIELQLISLSIHAQ